MKRPRSVLVTAALLTVLSLLLSACSPPFSLPRATEPRNLAQVSVMGVDAGAETVTVYAATQGRGDNPVTVFRGSGASLAAARLKTRDQGLQNVSYAHVEDIVLSERAAAAFLPALLDYSFQNREQSMECRLWVLRDASLGRVFTPEAALAARLVTLKTGSEAGTSLPGCTLREAAARLADDGALLLPALCLTSGGKVSPAGYAVFREGKPAGYLEEAEALGAAVLSGASCYWTGEVETEEGSLVTVELHSRGSDARALWEGGRLTALRLGAEVDGKLFGKTEEALTDLEAQVERLVEEELSRAAQALQALGADAAGLRRKAGLSAPWRWPALKEAWESYPTLPVLVEASVRMSQ